MKLNHPPPLDMRRTDQWICWTTEVRENADGEEKNTKVPRAPWAAGHTGMVSATNPENFTDFETALDWAEKMPNWGLGFSFRADGPFVGIDLDDCVTLQDDGPDIADWAEDIIDRVDSYTEYSPSGNGLHILIRGTLGSAVKNDAEGVELYDRDRYFTVTGKHLFGTPGTANERQAVLDELAAEYLVERRGLESDGSGGHAAPTARVGGDDDVVDTARHDGDERSSPPESGRTSGVRKRTTHPLFDLDVTDIYPSIPVGKNVPHPIHSSHTGANFKIHDNGETAICWHGQHAYGSGDGCGLGAQHLLAMEFERRDDCDGVRHEWDRDDSLVLAAYVQAVKGGHIRPCEPPYRAVRAVLADFLPRFAEELDKGGKTSWAYFRAGSRMIAQEYGIEVPLDD